MRPWIYSGLGFVAFIAAGYGMFRYHTVRGLQAEAQIMLSYLHTMEAAYFLEHRQYIGFDEWYGAPFGSQNHCARPKGAETLGLLLRWCHEEGGREPVRYAYRIRLTEDGYRIDAKAGFDESGGSFVCFGDHERDEWTSGKDGRQQHVINCEKGDSL